MNPWDKFKAYVIKKVLFRGCMTVCGAYYLAPAVGSLFLKFSSPERVLTISPSIYPVPEDFTDYFKPLIAETNFKMRFYAYDQTK